MESSDKTAVYEMAEELRNSAWEVFLGAAALTDCERDHKILKQIRHVWDSAHPISKYLAEAEAEIKSRASFS